MKFLFGYQTSSDITNAVPLTCSEQDANQIILNMIQFTHIAEDIIDSDKDNTPIEDLLSKAIFQFSEANKEFSHKRLFPDFDETTSPDETVRLETFSSIVIDLMGEFWFYGEHFHSCLEKHPTTEGINTKELFVSALYV